MKVVFLTAVLALTLVSSADARPVREDSDRPSVACVISVPVPGSVSWCAIIRRPR